jgi:hypothetical protein
MNLKSDKGKIINRFINQLLLLFAFSVYFFHTHSSIAGLDESSNGTLKDIPKHFHLKKINGNNGVITSQPESSQNSYVEDFDQNFTPNLSEEYLKQNKDNKKTSRWLESAALTLGCALKFLPISPFSDTTTQIIGNFATSALCIKGSCHHIFEMNKTDQYDFCTNICIPYSSAVITSAVTPYDAGILRLLGTSGVNCILTTTGSLLYYSKK